MWKFLALQEPLVCKHLQHWSFLPMIFTGNHPCLCLSLVCFSLHIPLPTTSIRPKTLPYLHPSSISFSYLSSHSFLHPLIPIPISFLKQFEKSISWVILPQFLQRKISLLEDNWSSIFFYYGSSLQFRFWLSMSFHSFSSAFLSCQCHGRTTRSFLDS